MAKGEADWRIEQGVGTHEDYISIGWSPLFKKPMSELTQSEKIADMLNTATGGNLPKGFKEKFVDKTEGWGWKKKKSPFQDMDRLEQDRELHNLIRQLDIGDTKFKDEGSLDKIKSLIKETQEGTPSGKQISSSYYLQNLIKNSVLNKDSFGSTWESGQGVQVASSNPTANLGIDWSKQFDTTSGSTKGGGSTLGSSVHGTGSYNKPEPPKPKPNTGYTPGGHHYAKGGGVRKANYKL